MGLSYRDQLKHRLSKASKEERAEIVRKWKPEDFHYYLEDPRAYDVILRPEQLAPAKEEGWHRWLMLTSRRWGKTLAGSYWVAKKIRESPPGTVGAILSQTKDTAKRNILKGKDGLITAFRDLLPGKAHFDERVGKFEFANGVTLWILSADAPDTIRGATFSWAWIDELFHYPNPEEVFTGAVEPAVSVGDNQILITTTPNRKHLAFIRYLRNLPGIKETRGTIFDNYALTQKIEQVRAIQADRDLTRKEKEEFLGVLLDDGALVFETDRIGRQTVDPATLQRIVVGVDPAASTNGETGIVVAGVRKDDSGKLIGYVLKDATISGVTPHGWASAVVGAYHQFNADRIIAERNMGGDMVESTIRQVDSNVPIKLITASKSKVARAEPVAALYEEGRVNHSGDPEKFQLLETEMETFNPYNINKQRSPNRVDALVWALSELMLTRQGGVKQIPKFFSLTQF